MAGLARRSPDSPAPVSLGRRPSSLSRGLGSSGTTTPEEGRGGGGGPRETSGPQRLAPSSVSGPRFQGEQGLGEGDRACSGGVPGPGPLEPEASPGCDRATVSPPESPSTPLLSPHGKQHGHRPSRSAPGNVSCEKKHLCWLGFGDAAGGPGSRRALPPGEGERAPRGRGGLGFNCPL